MRDLDKALADIVAIRSQIARTAEFRGYGPVTVAATGVLAMLAALVQALWLPDPAADVAGYLTLWVMTAGVCVALVGVEMVARSRRIHTVLADEMIQAATQQFMPAAVAGLLLTLVSLGLLASCWSLPSSMFAIGVWYLAAGLGSLAFANEAQAFSPWAMGAPFGIGQLLMAAILNWSTATSDVES